MNVPYSRLVMEIEHSPNDHIAVCGNVVVHRTEGHSTVEGVGRVREKFEESSARSGLLVIMENRLELAGGRGRKELQKMFEALDGQLEAVAYVLVGGGFWASAARSMLTGIILAARPSFPVLVFDREEDAIDWLRECLGDAAPTTQSMVDAVAASRAGADASNPLRASGA